MDTLEVYEEPHIQIISVRPYNLLETLSNEATFEEFYQYQEIE